MVHFRLQPHAASPPSPSSRHRVASPDKAVQAVQALPGKAVQVVGSTCRSDTRADLMEKAAAESEEGSSPSWGNFEPVSTGEGREGGLSVGKLWVN